MRRWSLEAALALLTGLSGYFHGNLLYLSKLNAPPSPPVLRSKPISPVTAQGARQVWVLFLDGLGPKVAETQKNLTRLSKLGPSRVLLARFPTFTEPALATMSTGVLPRYSGIRLNGGPAPLLERVSDLAVRGGYEVLIAATGFEAFFDYLSAPQKTKRVSTDAAFDHPPDTRALVWLYFGDIDSAGHRFGGDSSAYRGAAAQADLLVGRAIAHLDLSQDALIVVSDHGHLDRGGHGGVEKEAVEGVFYAAGYGLKGRHLPPIGQEHLSATLTALLGQARPKHAQASAMRDVIERPPSQPTEVVELNEPMESVESIDLADIERFEATHERAARIRLALALLFLFGGCVLLRARLGPLDFLPWLLFTFVFAAMYALAGYSFSWSVPRGHAAFVIETALFGIIAFAIATRWMKRARARQEALASVLSFGGIYFLASAYAGLDLRWLGGPSSSFAVILGSTLAFYACIFSGLRALRAS